MASSTSPEEIHQLGDRALAELEAVVTQGDLQALESWRIAYLGRRGKFTAVLRSLASLSLEQRRAAGALANQVKDSLEQRFAQAQQRIQEVRAPSAESQPPFDVTLPGRPVTLGRLHPTTQVVREICQAFVTMGFQIVEGPEVEWDTYNFGMLNIPQDHPARDMWDTLWIDYRDEEGKYPMLLRTHTSPVQIRVMQQQKPPVRVVVPGKCYRYEATDVTHEWHFYQIEGLAVDEGITFANLKGTLYEFARLLFGADRRVRFRCDYFPFVEPGVEMAIDCFACGGEGCRVCKKTGWIEIMGAGMVHPRVLEGVGYDSSKYTGFAFGMGVERIAMLKYDIDDIRLFYSNDLRFLGQF